MSAPADDRGDGGGREEQHGESTAQHDIGQFRGSDNPRHLRALNGLLRHSMPREHLDREAGCSNGPALIAELRRRGLAVPCDRTPVIDRDGREVKRGVYHLTTTDRRRIIRWLATRRVRS